MHVPQPKPRRLRHNDAMAEVLFVHGVGGPVPGWDRALQAALARRLAVDPGADAPTPGGSGLPSMRTVRYDDVFESGPAQLDSAAWEVGRREGPARAEFSGRQRSLERLVDRVARRPGGTDGEGRLRLPGVIPGEMVVRWPFSGMSHARAYRRDLSARDRARARVASAVASVAGPRIVVAHSLGSVVVLDALHVHDVRVDLLVTIGSPLGIDRDWGSLWVGGQGFPHHRIGGWLNVVNTRDPIPWNRGVSARFPDAVDAFITAGRLPVGPGGAHDPATYTSSEVVVEAVVETLDAARLSDELSTRRRRHDDR